MLHNLCHLTHGNSHAAARDPRWRIGIESVDCEQQDRFFAGVVVLQVVKGREGSFSVPGGQKR